jgi:hypothetical protein
MFSDVGRLVRGTFSDGCLMMGRFERGTFESSTFCMCTKKIRHLGK